MQKKGRLIQDVRDSTHEQATDLEAPPPEQRTDVEVPSLEQHASISAGGSRVDTSTPGDTDSQSAFGISTQVSTLEQHTNCQGTVPEPSLDLADREVWGYKSPGPSVDFRGFDDIMVDFAPTNTDVGSSRNMTNSDMDLDPPKNPTYVVRRLMREVLC